MDSAHENDRLLDADKPPALGLLVTRRFKQLADGDLMSG